MVWRLLFDVVEIGVELWALTIDRIRGEVEKHQATNGERDERGKLRVKMVWVKFWICDLCIQICSDGFCSDGFCSDVGGVFCSDGFLKINANDGFCVCFAMRHGLMSFMCVLQWGMYRWVFFFFFGKSSSGGSGFGCGYGYGRGFFFFLFLVVLGLWLMWWWLWVDEKERKIERRRTNTKRKREERGIFYIILIYCR